MSMSDCEEFKRGRGRPTSNPKCGVCRVPKLEHPGDPYREEFVNLSCAAAKMRMSVAAVRRRIEKGELEPMIPLKSLDLYLESLK